MSGVRGVGAVPDAPTPQPLTDESPTGVLADLLRHAQARRVLADQDRCEADHEAARRVLGLRPSRLSARSKSDGSGVGE